MWWFILSNNPLMSPSISQVVPYPLRPSNLAVCVYLFGLNPWEESKKIGEKAASTKVFSACWIILSLGLGIPRGRIFPFSLGFKVLLAPPG